MSNNSDNTNFDQETQPESEQEFQQETQAETQAESEQESQLAALAAEQLATFNKKFEEQKLQVKNRYKKKEKELNSKSNKLPPYTPIYSQNMWSMLVNLKNAWFDIMDDLLNGKFSWNIFSKDSRLFYVGLTFCIIAIVLFLLEYITNDEKETKGNVMEVRHIYEYINAPPQVVASKNLTPVKI